LGQGDAADGHKRDDIGGADTRMDAALGSQIDELGCLAGSANGSLDDSLRRAGNGHHGAIMVAVQRPIQQRDPLDAHSVENGMHFFAIHALGEIGHALDDGFGHKTSFPPRIADRELHARVHARIGISHAGIGDVNRIGGDRDRLLRLHEIMDA